MRDALQVMIHALEQPVAQTLTPVVIGDQRCNHAYDEQANNSSHAQFVHFRLYSALLFVLCLWRSLLVRHRSDRESSLRRVARSVRAGARCSVRVLLCLCWSLHVQGAVASAVASEPTAVAQQPHEQDSTGSLVARCQMKRSRQVSCIDRFRPRPTPDQLRDCHNSDTGWVVPDMPGLSNPP